MVCVIKMSSSISFWSTFCCKLINLMMLIISSVSMFEYMFAMSKDASLVYWFMGMSFRSSINCNEFQKLNVLGSGMCSCKSLDSILPVDDRLDRQVGLMCFGETLHVWG